MIIETDKLKSPSDAARKYFEHNNKAIVAEIVTVGTFLINPVAGVLLSPEVIIQRHLKRKHKKVLDNITNEKLRGLKRKLEEIGRNTEKTGRKAEKTLKKMNDDYGFFDLI